MDAKTKKQVSEALKAAASTLSAAVSLEEVASALRSTGLFRKVQVEDDFVDAEPRNRSRLDHYGNDGDGWDEDGWEEEYASPLRQRVRKALDERFGKGAFQVNVGDKGFVEVQPNRSYVAPKAEEPKSVPPPSGQKGEQLPLTPQQVKAITALVTKKSGVKMKASKPKEETDSIHYEWSGFDAKRSCFLVCDFWRKKQRWTVQTYSSYQAASVAGVKSFDDDSYEEVLDLLSSTPADRLFP